MLGAAMLSTGLRRVRFASIRRRAGVQVRRQYRVMYTMKIGVCTRKHKMLPHHVRTPHTSPDKSGTFTKRRQLRELSLPLLPVQKKRAQNIHYSFPLYVSHTHTHTQAQNSPVHVVNRGICQLAFTFLSFIGLSFICPHIRCAKRAPAHLPFSLV